MLGYGALTVHSAVDRCRKLSKTANILLVGSFSGPPDVELPTGVQTCTAEESRDIDRWDLDLSNPVLTLHDDAIVSRSSLARLLRSHNETGAPTVPYTNDMKTQHYLGPLPTDIRSKKELDSVRPPATSTSIHTAATAIVASGAQTRQIFASRIAPAATRLVQPEFVVARAVVSHIGSCLVREKAPSDAENPLLVASMIVKDESRVIEASLRSLQGVVDRVEVVDTGSTDDTVEKCLALGASVSHAPWEDDFGKARNIALDRCRDARFVLIVDADEVVDCPDPDLLRDFLHTSGSEHDAFKVTVKNVDGGTLTSGFHSVRIVPAGKSRWKGSIHETLVDPDSGTPLAGPELMFLGINHFGYAQATVLEKGKKKRNIGIAEAAYAANPGFKTRFDLARSLAWQPESSARATELFRKALEEPENAGPTAIAYVEANVAMADLETDDVAGALELAAQSAARCDGEYAAHLVMAKCWEKLGDDAAIIDAHKAREGRNLRQPMFDVMSPKLATYSIIVGALARSARADEALALAVRILDDRPQNLLHWAELAANLPEAGRSEILGTLVQLDAAASFLGQIVEHSPPALLAEIALSHASAGHRQPDLLIAGIMAGLVSGREAISEHLALVGAEHLDAEHRKAVAERARIRGADTVAAILDPSVVVPDPV